jgi:integrase
LTILQNLSGKDCEFVLPRIKEWSQGQQSKVLKEFCYSIGVTRTKFHTLRACFATQLISQGAGPIKVMQVCDWRDLKAMTFYVRMAGVDEKSITDKLTKFL